MNIMLLYVIGNMLFPNVKISVPPLLDKNNIIDPVVVHDMFPIDLANASSIFNTIQSALKQRDSNTHPAGVSFIPAYIPPNTRIYHARNDSNLPDLFEWIAFNYEFSYSFSGFRRQSKEQAFSPWNRNFFFYFQNEETS